MADAKKVETVADPVVIEIEKPLPNGEIRVRQCAEADFEYFRRKGFKKIVTK